jgi:uncharacterized membrane protein YccC
MVITSVGVCLAAVLGAAIAWKSDFVATSKPTTDSNLAAPKQAAPAAAQASAAKTAPAQPAPVTQAAAPSPSPELAKQLETMAQDLAAVRRSVEQLSAKQEQLAAAQQQLDQLASKQTQLVAKQEQLAQNLAKLQATEQNVKPKDDASDTISRGCYTSAIAHDLGASGASSATAAGAVASCSAAANTSVMRARGISGTKPL